MSGRSETLERARNKLDLSIAELWLRYFALGGSSSPLEVDAYLQGALFPADHEYDILAQALNERFLEQGGDHPVPYSESR